MFATRCRFSPAAGLAIRPLSSIATLALLIIAGCVSEPPTTAPTADPLMAPIPQAPADGSAYGYRSTGDPPQVELVWRHGMPTAQVPNPHQAELFIVCVYDKERGRCESGMRKGVPPPMWLEAAAADPTINRTPIELERTPFDSPMDLRLGFEFRTRLRMRPEYRDRTLLWQVGACLNGTCRLSDPRALRVGQAADPVGI